MEGTSTHTLEEQATVLRELMPEFSHRTLHNVLRTIEARARSARWATRI